RSTLPSVYASSITLITPTRSSRCGTSPRWVTLPTMFTLIRRKKACAFWPMVTMSTSTPCSLCWRISPSSLRNRLLLRPPARWPITCFIACAYGREVRIRSCALRILEAETISSARVTLRVFCTLLILVLISRPPAISSSRLAGPGARRLDLVPSTRRDHPPRFGLPGTGRLELFDALFERSLDLVVPGAGAVDLLDQLAGGVGEVGVQAFLEGTDLGDRHVVQVTLVDGVDRQRLVGDRHRQVLL